MFKLIICFLLTLNFIQAKQADEFNSFIRRSITVLHTKINEETLQELDQYFQTAQKNLSSAHKLYQFMAALVMTGSSELLNLHDEILLSGYKGDNNLIEKLGFRWGTQKMNTTEERILQARFLLELHKGAKSNAAPPFTTKNVWNAWYQNKEHLGAWSETNALDEQIKTQNNLHAAYCAFLLMINAEPATYELISTPQDINIRQLGFAFAAANLAPLCHPHRRLEELAASILLKGGANKPPKELIEDFDEKGSRLISNLGLTILGISQIWAEKTHQTEQEALQRGIELVIWAAQNGGFASYLEEEEFKKAWYSLENKKFQEAALGLKEGTTEESQENSPHTPVVSVGEVIEEGQSDQSVEGTIVEEAT